MTGSQFPSPSEIVVPLETHWWWVRHAPVTEMAGLIYGDSDPNANTGETNTYAALAAHLPTDAVWVVSHLRRTHQTAQAIATAGYEVPQLLVESRLGEQGFGHWHGRSHEAHDSTRRDPYLGVWNCAPDEIPPGGESFVDMMGRVSQAIDELTERYSGRHIVCVAHGGTIRAALAHALSLKAHHALSFSIDNESLTRIRRSHDAPPDGVLWRVLGVNERF